MNPYTIIKCKPIKITVSVNYHYSDGTKHKAYYDLRKGLHNKLIIRRDRIIKDSTTITRFFNEMRKSFVKFLS